MNDYRDLSLRLERETGCDSIPTIERIYAQDIPGEPPYICVWPDCRLHRRDPVAMWRHVHFSRRHGYSFGIRTPEEAA